jgi:hypothetical protein
VSDDIDIEPQGDTLDGVDPKDSDDAAVDDGDGVRAKRPKQPKHQGRRGKRVRFPMKEPPGYIDVLMP